MKFKIFEKIHTKITDICYYDMKNKKTQLIMKERNSRIIHDLSQFSKEKIHPLIITDVFSEKSPIFSISLKKYNRKIWNNSLNKGRQSITVVIIDYWPQYSIKYTRKFSKNIKK